MGSITDRVALDRIAEILRVYADPRQDDADPIDLIADVVAETGR